MSRVRVLVIAVSVLLPVLVLVALVLRPVPAQTRDASVVVVATDVVSAGLVDAFETAGDDVVEPLTASSSEEARVAVEQGDVVAALTVDLEAENDVLYVAGANGSRVNTAVITAVEDVMATFDRTVVVQDVNPADVRPVVPPVLVAVGLLLGIVTMLVRRWGGRFRRTARPPRHLAERIGTDALLYGVVLGLAAVFAGLPGSPPVWIGLGVLLVALSATLTAAVLRAIGAWGLGLVVALLVLPTWVIVRAPHVQLLPASFEAVGRWLPHGAAADVASRMALFGDTGSAQPWLVLLAWAAVGVAALVLVLRFTRAPSSEVAVVAED
ncbi:hypothetical protein [Aeromicrobium sp. Leaf350]|uniref:hypothetical protein n=1 Tax=Aeromicrobium sp. Leaf350 TaxID=2876565 RepID=UPI001E4C8193|nr:hypothetical protein [Aeromicrobium sp. Leaf350]